LIFPGGATGELDLIRLFPVVGMKQEPTVNNFGKRLAKPRKARANPEVTC
jgi:hypothetical protein